MAIQQIAYNVNDVDRPLSLPSLFTVKLLTLSQEEFCERVLENGSLLRIPLQITTLHAVSNMRERRSGSVTVTPLRNGR